MNFWPRRPQPAPVSVGEQQILAQLARIASVCSQFLAELVQLLADTSRTAGAVDQLRKEVSDLAGLTKNDFDTLVRAIDQETDAIAARIDNLITTLKNTVQPDGSLNPADTTALFAALDAESARLQSLGSNPADPIPGAIGTTTTG